MGGEWGGQKEWILPYVSELAAAADMKGDAAGGSTASGGDQNKWNLSLMFRSDFRGWLWYSYYCLILEPLIYWDRILFFVFFPGDSNGGLF